jgi:hypothetical protein
VINIPLLVSTTSIAIKSNTLIRNFYIYYRFKYEIKFADCHRVGKLSHDSSTMQALIILNDFYAGKETIEML